MNLSAVGLRIENNRIEFHRIHIKTFLPGNRFS
jgi:hypothetical protein